MAELHIPDIPDRVVVSLQERAESEGVSLKHLVIVALGFDTSQEYDQIEVEFAPSPKSDPIEGLQP